MALNEVEVAIARTVLLAAFVAIVVMVVVDIIGVPEADNSIVDILLINLSIFVWISSTRKARSMTLVDEAIELTSAESLLKDELTHVTLFEQISPVNVRFPFSSSLNISSPF